jgi:hypothetical protein
MFVYDTKGKEHQTTRQSDLYLRATPPRTNQITSCLDALSITYYQRETGAKDYSGNKPMGNFLETIKVHYHEKL